MEKPLDTLREWMLQASNAVFFTGAGISIESGMGAVPIERP
jgi:NAD-dependent SIR2 family protein deacetylase